MTKNINAITEQLKQTQLAYLMAREMSQFKAGFLARISHELRSPLNSLIGIHKLILADLCDDPAEEREFIKSAHTAALKLMKLIDKIVAVSKIEHGIDKLEIQPLQLTTVLEEVYNLTYLQAINYSLKIEVLPPAQETYILADPKCLRQVLVNLVEMAINNMKEGKISISTHIEQKSPYIYIWIDAQFPEEIYSESVRLLQSDSTEFKAGAEQQQLSSGLNLLIAQTLMEVMGGALEFVTLADTSTGEMSTNVNRIQCCVPVVIPKTSFPEQIEN